MPALPALPPRMEADDDWDDAILPRVGLVGSGRVSGADAVVVPPAVPLGEGTSCSYVSVFLFVCASFHSASLTVVFGCGVTI